TRKELLSHLVKRDSDHAVKARLSPDEPGQHPTATGKQDVAASCRRPTAYLGGKHSLARPGTALENHPRVPGVGIKRPVLKLRQGDQFVLDGPAQAPEARN